MMLIHIYYIHLLFLFLFLWRYIPFSLLRSIPAILNVHFEQCSVLRSTDADPLKPKLVYIDLIIQSVPQRKHSRKILITTI
jgi:hypothetical protein